MESLDSIEDAIADIKSGKMVIVVDDEDRENEGDLIMAAEKATPEAVAFMVNHGSGIICTPLTQERAIELDLTLMVPTEKNTEFEKTKFTVSIDAKHGTSTGISASDRSTTILKLTDPSARPNDFRRPGHIFPLIAEEGGVLKRNGHTEAAVDLARLADLRPVGFICEIVNGRGDMARFNDLVKFKERHGLKMITIAELIRYRRDHEGGSAEK